MCVFHTCGDGELTSERWQRFVPIPGYFPGLAPALTGSSLHVISQWMRTVILARCLAPLQCVSFPPAVAHGRWEHTHTDVMGT